MCVIIGEVFFDSIMRYLFCYDCWRRDRVLGYEVLGKGRVKRCSKFIRY